MATRKEQRVTFERLYPPHNAIGTRTDLLRGFSPRAAVAKQTPVWTLTMNLNAAATLVLTIVPLKQIIFNLGFLTKTGQRTSPGRPLQWARQNLFEFHPIQPLAEAARITLAALG
jgi:hypothetical protein